jgi:hypothetical protein
MLGYIKMNLNNLIRQTDIDPVEFKRICQSRNDKNNSARKKFRKYKLKVHPDKHRNNPIPYTELFKRLECCPKLSCNNNNVYNNTNNNSNSNVSRYVPGNTNNNFSNFSNNSNNMNNYNNKVSNSLKQRRMSNQNKTTIRENRTLLRHMANLSHGLSEVKFNENMRKAKSTNMRYLRSYTGFQELKLLQRKLNRYTTNSGMSNTLKKHIQQIVTSLAKNM